ncbi:MAG: lecithin retinol acyltransferase family protein [Pirellulales bacterium]
MSKGEHLAVRRSLYWHHGIDLGDGHVMHYGRGLDNKKDAVVESVTWNIFSQGRSVQIVPGERRFSPDTVVDRAWSRLGERCYDVLDNNCESFVRWCRTGVAESHQARAAETCVASLTAAALKSCCWPVYATVAKRTVARGLRSGLTRRIVPGLIAADAVHGGVTWGAMAAGLKPSMAQQLGRTGAMATAAGFGLATGGPAGAAVSLANWSAGDRMSRVAIESIRAARRAIRRYRQS